MEADERTPPDPGRRLLGWTFVTLGVIGALAAIAGVPTDSGADRLVLAAVAVVLLAVGSFRARATMPGVTSIAAQESGLTVTADGRRVTVPWSDVDAVWLRKVTSVYGTERWLLRLQYRGTAHRPEALREFEGRADSGLGELLIGLTGDQELALRRQLPGTAGERFGIRD